MKLHTNGIEVPENDNDDDATMVNDHIVQMVNDAYQCFSEIPNMNYENVHAASMKKIKYINQY